MSLVMEDIKKRIERAYLEEARRASSIFPSGQLIGHERPDFLVSVGGKTLGIEVTELCREKPRAENGRLAKVASRAKKRYETLASAGPVGVSAVFALNVGNVELNVLVNGLADFVHAHQTDKRHFIWRDELPAGYSNIWIFEKHGEGRWNIPLGSDGVLAKKELIETRIAEKQARLPEYQKVASENWLLIVNDRFLGAGEVYVRPDHLAEWTFSSDFDKVLLFLREPGGTGEVIEAKNHRLAVTP